MQASHPAIDFNNLERLGEESAVAISSEERWAQIVGMMQFAATVMENSPDRERIQAYKESQEAEWQSVMKRLLANASCL
jgi:hypothetical protein